MSTNAKLKILAVTTIRSDYDLMSGIYQALHQHPDVELGLVVGSAHLSATFGHTVDAIEADKLPIIAKIECLIDSNTPASRIKTGAILLQSSIDIVNFYQPDVILYAGDREDALMFATMAAYLQIPSIHFFGGDHASDGNVDNPVRHAVSKLATFHFVTHDSHKERLIKIGEHPERIHVIGNPALDKFRLTPHITKQDCLKALNITELNNYVLMIYHPILGEEEQAANEASCILDTLLDAEYNVIVGSPNTDAGSRAILQAYERYKSHNNVFFYRSLPRTTFINLVRHAELLIGNSSMGLLEAPSIPLAVINVGSRQRGRLAADNVIFVDGNRQEISQALSIIQTPAFQKQLAEVVNPYGDGHTVESVVDTIFSLDYTRYLHKKEDPIKIS